MTPVPKSSTRSVSSSIGTAFGPSVALPLRFVLTGVVAFFVGALWLVLRPDILATYHYTQYAVAVTHVFTLGWVTTIVMGAMYQLVPVALETHLYSERLGRWQFVLHAIGTAGMIWSFWIWNMKYVGHFGSAVGLGMILFAYNIGRTLARVPRWNVVAWAIAGSLFWMVTTMLAGLYLSADKCWNFSFFPVIAQIHAHAHLGVVGFFLTLLFGVSYKLVPMFALSEIQNERRATAAMVLLSTGLVLAFAGILKHSVWRLVGAVTLVVAIAVYGMEMRAILRARKRRTLDWGLRYFVTALLMLIPVSVIGLVLAWPNLPATMFTTQLENVYGYLGLVGVLSLAIIGMSYKIVPFLVWYKSYSPLIGKSKVPALGDMYSTRLQILGYWSYLAGLLATSIAMALGNEPATQAASALLGASLLVYAVNLGKILSHFWKPKIEPLALKPEVEKSGVWIGTPAAAKSEV